MSPVSTLFEAARLAAQVQGVILLRSMRLAAGDASAATEATRMVTEKVAALSESQLAFWFTVMHGHRPHVAARRALTPYRKRVRKNLARLSRRR